MDMMEIRRGLLSQMANNGYVKKGQFTLKATGTEGETFYIDIGKTLSKYVVVVEMSEESKEALAQRTEITGQRVFEWVGIYPYMRINNKESTTDALVGRIQPSANSVNVSTTSYINTSSTRFGFSCYKLQEGGSAWGLYYGFTYNYWLLELN